MYVYIYMYAIHEIHDFPCWQAIADVNRSIC